jgi:DNA-binding transcriptional MerR regulator
MIDRTRYRGRPLHLTPREVRTSLLEPDGDPALEPRSIKVGELAARTGVSVRTLHHYHEIGLLPPSRRNAAGHRLYSEGDVVRLLRIRTLQQLGFSLDEVGQCLADRRYSLERVLELRLQALRATTERAQRLCRVLEALLERARADGGTDVGQVLEAIEEMTMFEKYYTQEQLARLAARRAQLGEDRIREVERAWPELIAAVRAEMAKGTDPSDPRMRELAARWHELVEEFTGGAADIRQSLQNLYAGEPAVAERQGLDRDLCSYVARASGRA